MPLKIVRADITRLDCDAIVNATDPQFSGSGGVDAAIHRGAGEKEMRRACDRLGGCRPGQAKLTRGYKLPCKYVIHTVGPVWHGGGQGEEEILRSCYRESLRLAESRRCRSIAFPPIASESFGYPKEEAIRVAADEIHRFLEHSEMQVTLTVFGRESFAAGRKLFSDVAEYIDQHYVEEHSLGRSQLWRPYDGAFSDAGFSVPDGAPAPGAPMPTEHAALRTEAIRPLRRRDEAADDEVWAPPPQAAKSARPSLEELLRNRDESFSQMLLRKIDEQGLTDAQCYKKANIDRKLFSKIRKDPLYKPSKPTAMAFAVALELPLEEAEELLQKAGFAFSHSSTFDLIVEYFIRSRNYNIFEINEVLFYYDQSLLGN